MIRRVRFTGHGVMSYAPGTTCTDALWPVTALTTVSTPWARSCPLCRHGKHITVVSPVPWHSSQSAYGSPSESRPVPLVRNVLPLCLHTQAVMRSPNPAQAGQAMRAGVAPACSGI